ncbi:hypothetical protein KYK29_07110 [Shinella daejeonensis]|uniref:hypothetical protein n=1 Tax=Shinella daejeonensis TaxID=659017 RepID=UPI0020C799D3|nr:hypothetical protein [Shinella daejeonensis]MCP8894695.1 hypothetical protein [Shinella daejeonensis]
MPVEQKSRHTENWPEESREAAQLVIDQYGDPDEITDERSAADPDIRLLSDEDLEKARREGEERG